MNDYQIAQHTGQALRLWQKLKSLQSCHGNHREYVIVTDDEGIPDVELVNGNKDRLIASPNFVSFLNKKTQLVDIEELI